MKKKSVKDKFEILVKERGFKSIHQFSKISGIESGNLYSNLTERFGPSVERLFIMANTLGVPIIDVMEIFYSEKLKENQTAIKKFKIPVD